MNIPSISISLSPHIPKYVAVANSIKKAVKKGDLRKGQRIPSINSLSTEHFLSRGTIESAYNLLMGQGVIASVKGKGYFIDNIDFDVPLRVLLIFNKISNYKREIYYAFLDSIGSQAKVDLKIHHWNIQVLETILQNNYRQYDYYVIMPHFYENRQNAIDLLQKIPQDKLILLDRDLPEVRGNHTAIYQDFWRDIIETLSEALPLLEKYKKLVFVNPTITPYPPEIKQGFCTFCKSNDFDFSVIENISEKTAIKKGEAYLVISETDLASLIKLCRIKKLEIGRDLGIISYNDTPLKEILLDGITVISTDHEAMGRTAAQLILDKRLEKVKNPFRLIKRRSL